jgi:hypothetical protein
MKFNFYNNWRDSPKNRGLSIADILGTSTSDDEAMPLHTVTADN